MTFAPPLTVTLPELEVIDSPVSTWTSLLFDPPLTVPVVTVIGPPAVTGCETVIVLGPPVVGFVAVKFTELPASTLLMPGELPPGPPAPHTGTQSSVTGPLLTIWVVPRL